MSESLRIVVIAYSYNERELMPAFVAHYKRMGAHIHIYDNHSTDGSDELARELGCKVQQHGSPDAFDSVEHTQVRNEGWKAYRTSHDIALVIDMDEFIMPVLPFSVNQPAVVRVQGYDCYSKSMPTQVPISDQAALWQGIPKDAYSKPCVLNLRKLRKITFEAGGHRVLRARPSVDYHMPPPLEVAPLLLHLRFVGGEDRLMARYRERLERVKRGGDFSRGESSLYKAEERYLEVLESVRSQAEWIEQPDQRLAKLSPEARNWPIDTTPTWRFW